MYFFRQFNWNRKVENTAGVQKAVDEKRRKKQQLFLRLNHFHRFSATHPFPRFSPCFFRKICFWIWQIFRVVFSCYSTVHRLFSMCCIPTQFNHFLTGRYVVEIENSVPTNRIRIQTVFLTPRESTGIQLVFE